MGDIRKPDFLCVGVQKAGTTTLHNILKNHPEIYLPKSKEAHFFDMNEKYKLGLDWWIDSAFNSYSGETIMGVITPEYLYFEEVPKRIFDDLGDIKIIVILRNPVERAYSHYKMSLKRGYENKPFDDAIALEKSRIEKDYFHKSHFSYMDRGYYYLQVERYLQYFSRENMLFLIFEEDIVRNIDKTILNILDFLNIDKSYRLDLSVKSNPATNSKSTLLRDFIYKKNIIKKMGGLLISNSMKIKFLNFLDRLNQTKENIESLTQPYKDEILSSYFGDDIQKLEQLIDRDLSVWRAKKSKLKI